MVKEGKSIWKNNRWMFAFLVHLLGTEYWPEHKNKILFIELPKGQDFNKGEPLPEVDSLLCDLELNGIFKEIILDNTKDYSFPILYGVDVGHSDPQITIPLGVEVEIDSSKNKFEVLESGIIPKNI